MQLPWRRRASVEYPSLTYTKHGTQLNSPVELGIIHPSQNRSALPRSCLGDQELPKNGSLKGAASHAYTRCCTGWSSSCRTWLNTRRFGLPGNAWLHISMRRKGVPGLSERELGTVAIRSMTHQPPAPFEKWTPPRGSPPNQGCPAIRSMTRFLPRGGYPNWADDLAQLP